MTNKKKTSSSIENKKKLNKQDFYIENGLIIFTQHFLNKRGYCCKNGCRHCPYEFNKTVE
ncbi:MAG: DUF5522 domain-containing protein [Saprospiraceae bacterium]